MNLECADHYILERQCLGNATLGESNSLCLECKPPLKALCSPPSAKRLQLGLHSVLRNQFHTRISGHSMLRYPFKGAQLADGQQMY